MWETERPNELLPHLVLYPLDRGLSLSWDEMSRRGSGSEESETEGIVGNGFRRELESKKGL